MQREALVCNDTTGDPTEVLDGKDDDRDAVIDEGFGWDVPSPTAFGRPGAPRASRRVAMWRNGAMEAIEAADSAGAAGPCAGREDRLAPGTVADYVVIND